MLRLPARFAAVILCFAPLFRQHPWRHAQVLLLGAILVPGQRTVTSILRLGGLRRERRFVNYHRVLNRAAWSGRAAARVLLGLLLEAFVPTGPVLLGLDDHLERRRGKRIRAKGIYRDPVRSSKGHFVKASGLRWLSLMLLVPIPWAGRVWALPFLTTLAPSERYAAERGRRHKTLTDWARQLVLQARRWMPERALVLVADSSFAALELLAGLVRGLVRQGVTCVTRLRLDAALYAPAPPRQPKTPGRPRTKGARLPTLAKVLADQNTVWQRLTVPDWYGEGARAWWRSAPGPPSGAMPGCPSCRSAGCCCATPAGASTRRPCSAPTRRKSRCRSSAGSRRGGGWRSPSERSATTSASRPSGSGRTGRSPAPRPACSACSPS
jgi:DDE superfamily endonuclease